MLKKIEYCLSKDARELEQKKVDLNELGKRVQNDKPGAAEEYQTTLKEAVEIEKRVVKRRWIAGITGFVVVVVTAIIGVIICSD